MSTHTDTLRALAASIVAEANAIDAAGVPVPVPTPVPPPAASWAPAQALTKPFAATSPWNTPIAAGAKFNPVAAPITWGYVNRESWSVPVFIAGPTDALCTLNYGRNWRPAGSVQFHCPANVFTNGTGNSDNNFIVVDTAVSPPLVHDVYGFTGKSGNVLTSGDYGVCSLADSGFSTATQPNTWPPTWPSSNAGCRATGASWLGGVIAGDLTKIDHALALGLPGTQLAGGAADCIPPAVWSDASLFNPTGNVREGARLAIPPATPQPAGLSALGKAIWAACVTYGCLVVDRSGSASLYMDVNSTTAQQASDARSQWGYIAPMLRIVA